MFNFDFSNPTRVLFGQGRIAALATQVPATARILLLYGGGSIHKNGVFAQVMSALGSRAVFEFASSAAATSKPPCPFGCVLTLPATGSEMNAGAVVTRHATREKRSFMSPAIFPAFSILDPGTTLSLPPRQVGNGVVVLAALLFAVMDAATKFRIPRPEGCLTAGVSRSDLGGDSNPFQISFRSTGLGGPA